MDARRIPRARARAALAVPLFVVLLTGCTGNGTPAPTTTAAAPSTAVSTAPPPTTATVAAPSSTAETATPANARGCSNGRTTIPAGASTAVIGDIDGDGRADTEFYSESGSFVYGIRTAAGGVYTLKDDLAGPGMHSGWTALLDGPQIPITVLDDSRTATLHAFVDCRFVTTYGVNGKPYTFGLNGFSEYGTGVACNDRNGGVLPAGVLAVKRSNGNYDIRWTMIQLSVDGRTATNGATETRWADLPATDPRVHAAMGSYCGTTPKVHTSGR